MSDNYVFHPWIFLFEKDINGPCYMSLLTTYLEFKSDPKYAVRYTYTTHSFVNLSSLSRSFVENKCTWSTVHINPKWVFLAWLEPVIFCLFLLYMASEKGGEFESNKTSYPCFMLHEPTCLESRLRTTEYSMYRFVYCYYNYVLR